MKPNNDVFYGYVHSEDESLPSELLEVVMDDKRVFPADETSRWTIYKQITKEPHLKYALDIECTKPQMLQVVEEMYKNDAAARYYYRLECGILVYVR